MNRSELKGDNHALEFFFQDLLHTLNYGGIVITVDNKVSKKDQQKLTQATKEQTKKVEIREDQRANIQETQTELENSRSVSQVSPRSVSPQSKCIRKISAAQICSTG